MPAEVPEATSVNTFLPLDYSNDHNNNYVY